MAAAASSTMEISRRHSSSSSMGSKLRVTGAPSHRALSVVSTGARSAERRDLLSTIGHLLWREGLSARDGVYPERSRGGPRSRRRESHMCDSHACMTGQDDLSEMAGDGM